MSQYLSIVESVKIKSNLFIYKIRVEFSGKSKYFLTMWLMSVLNKLGLKPHFYNWIFPPLLGNLSGQNIVPNQILAC